MEELLITNKFRTILVRSNTFAEGLRDSEHSYMRIIMNIENTLKTFVQSGI